MLTEQYTYLWIPYLYKKEQQHKLNDTFKKQENCLLLKSIMKQLYTNTEY